MTMKQGKTKTVFVCESCGVESPKWAGRCPECGEWGTVLETEIRSARPRSGRLSGGGDGPIPLPDVDREGCPRASTGVSELDRVLGGGVVKGSAILVAGDPGIGKSTLLLMASAGLALSGGAVLYVSGEESLSQVRLRAERLGIEERGVHLLAETDLDTILGHSRKLRPDLLVVDSVQTVHREGIPSAPGSVTQVRECAAELTLFAKSTGVPVVMIGHVTKSGDVAGPRILAHVVDAVLSFEGDRYHTYRVLRAVKNRFGATEEIGIFEMQKSGLAEVGNPAGLWLAGSPDGPGRVVVPVVEGSRVLLVEIQALVTRPPVAPGRRRVTGVDPGRIDLLLAVLEKKGGLAVSGLDVFVNAVGGVRAEEPATDLGVALALASSLLDREIPSDVVAFGEIGLLSEVRPVGRGAARLSEAAKLGFRRALVPPGTEAPPGIRAIPVPQIEDALDRFR